MQSYYYFPTSTQKNLNYLPPKLFIPHKVANFAAEKSKIEQIQHKRLMKKILFAVMAAVVCLAAHAQVDEKMEALRSRGFGARNTAVAQVSAVEDSVARIEEQKQRQAQGDTEPSFRGGEMFLKAYLKKKLLHSNVSGTGDVVISFRVDEKGNIHHAEVTQSAGSILDTAAFNIVTGMARWIPGTTNGVPVDKPASVTVSFGKEDW